MYINIYIYIYILIYIYIYVLYICIYIYRYKSPLKSKYIQYYNILIYGDINEKFYNKDSFYWCPNKIYKVGAFSSWDNYISH